MSFKRYILWCTSNPKVPMRAMAEIKKHLDYTIPDIMRKASIQNTNTLQKIDTEYFSIRFAFAGDARLEGLYYDAVFGYYEGYEDITLSRLKDHSDIAMDFYHNRRNSEDALYAYLSATLGVPISNSDVCEDDPPKHIPSIKKAIFNGPATIVLWADGTKTVVKAQNGEEIDPEKGLAMAISKKALGNQGNYYNTFKKWTCAEVCYETSLKILKSTLRRARKCLDKVKDEYIKQGRTRPEGI